MSVHSTTTNEQVEVRPVISDGTTMVRVWDWDTDPDTALVLADLRLTPMQALRLADALVAAVSEDNPHAPWPIEPLCCSYHSPTTGAA